MAVFALYYVMKDTTLLKKKSNQVVPPEWGAVPGGVGSGPGIWKSSSGAAAVALRGLHCGQARIQTGAPRQTATRVQLATGAPCQAQTTQRQAATAGVQLATGAGYRCNYSCTTSDCNRGTVSYWCEVPMWTTGAPRQKAIGVQLATSAPRPTATGAQLATSKPC